MTSQNIQCNILLISGDLKLNAFLYEYLNNSNINLNCLVVNNYDNIKKERDDINLDLIILDIDSFVNQREVISKIADDLHLSNTPKIIMSSDNSTEMKIYAFEMSIDEFVLKPFVIEELIARIKNINRRYKRFIGVKVITAGKINMDLITGTVTVNDNKIRISAKESGILKLFLENKNRIFTRSEILLSVWKNPNGINERTVDVHINRLRTALGNNDEGRSYIKTVRSAGYGVDIIEESNSINFNEYNVLNYTNYDYDKIGYNVSNHEYNYAH